MWTGWSRSFIGGSVVVPGQRSSAVVHLIGFLCISLCWGSGASLHTPPPMPQKIFRCYCRGDGGGGGGGGVSSASDGGNGCVGVWRSARSISSWSTSSAVSSFFPHVELDLLSNLALRPASPADGSCCSASSIVSMDSRRGGDGGRGTVGCDALVVAEAAHTWLSYGTPATVTIRLDVSAVPQVECSLSHPSRHKKWQDEINPIT